MVAGVLVWTGLRLVAGLTERSDPGVPATLTVLLTATDDGTQVTQDLIAAGPQHLPSSVDLRLPERDRGFGPQGSFTDRALDYSRATDSAGAALAIVPAPSESAVRITAIPSDGRTLRVGYRIALTSTEHIAYTGSFAGVDVQRVEVRTRPAGWHCWTRAPSRVGKHYSCTRRGSVLLPPDNTLGALRWQAP
jgi:hypothetical protein